MRIATSDSDDALEALLADARIWRGRQTRTPHIAALPTGWAAFDDVLPGGGWPTGALTEILPAQEGAGELRLLLPALARLTDAKRENAWVAWISPPYVPYAPALAAAGVRLERLLIVRARQRAAGGVSGDENTLWAAEQTLRSGLCAAVIGWFGRIDDRGLRRLQLAAEEGRAWGVAYRPAGMRAQHSPAALRLLVRPLPAACASSGMLVEVLKCRGGRPASLRCLHASPMHGSPHVP